MRTGKGLVGDMETMSLRHLWRGPVSTDWLQSVAQGREWGWGGSRVQEEIGVSSQRAIDKCVQEAGAA